MTTLAPSSQTVITFTLNGNAVQANEGESILQAAQRHGVDIPHLCYKDGLRADGNCRACVVEIAGERTLAPSCCRSVTAGMQVQAHSERAVKSQKLVLELLLSDMPDQGYKWNDGERGLAGQHGELSDWAARLNVSVRPQLKALRREQPRADVSHPAMAVNLDACIQCTRCVRACREVQVNDVIGYAHRGAHSAIVFDLQDPMGNSTCVACGECVQVCPTGALMPKTLIGSQRVDKVVDSVCPFCGVGCLLSYKVRDNKIVAVDGRDGPANHSRLCVKGRFGFDYAHHPHRLTQPLIRRADVPKDTTVTRDPADWASVFRVATWDEALNLVGGQLQQLRDAFGPKSLAGFGSAKGSNEEAYLFQKLVRTGFGSNNVDHCTRLCHASSVAALLEGVGSGAVSNQVSDVDHAELILVIGSNTAGNHPVAATWMKNAAKRGLKIVTADPRGTDLDKQAWRTLQFKADTDVALINAMIHTIIEEGLTDPAFIAARVSNFEAVREGVRAFSPEAMAPVCGIPAARIREVARAYAKAKAAMIFWGMGISQHVHGTDNVRSLIALCMVAGQIGKPGSGLHPLRGQNNVQGASDAGLIPMMFPNYQRVTDKAAHDWFEKFWGAKLDDQPGYTVVEIMRKALSDESDPHKVRGMYIMGENPAMSDPDLNHSRRALASLSHLVVQDIFMTETAWLADVVLPATAWPEKTGTVSNTDRMVQLGRQAIEPPGNAKPDLWIIQQIAQRMGLTWNYGEMDAAAPGRPKQGTAPSGGSAVREVASVGAMVAVVYEEMRQAMHTAIGGIRWARLQREGSVTYPCLSAADPGQATMFADHFPTSDGRAHLVPTLLIQADEKPDADYPLVLITGRQLEHWHTGSMTRRSQVLDALEPVATASVNGRELERLGVPAGTLVNLRSRRGAVTVRLRCDDGTPDGTVFMPFVYREAAANLLTNAALDPIGKIPEFKYCAVCMTPINE
ncbi:MAG: molybdopterin-dependent oxidoreductase [Rhodoferax sp.]|uniref:molybdopterin-dependent oxidoreductase n=1 Tax=Rhodoferax sp. TaxID=50421 RepID=UPI0017DF7F2F|nr:molybdopterin-dependent oxidoreductase [Rhodoferax sp.]NMM12153.1 molybdopterin-dependent oxidoreductase [Rhodoferax sp.]